MNIKVEFGKYIYRTVIILLALLLPVKTMAKATKALRESEAGNKPKKPPKSKPPNKNNTS